MTTLENTISMMRVLPETEQVKIQNFTRKLFQRFLRWRAASNCALTLSYGAWDIGQSISNAIDILCCIRL